MAFQLSDFGSAILDTESVKPVSDVDLDKALLDVEAYGSAVDTIGSAFGESMRVYGNLIMANNDINFDSRHLSFAREHLETIFTHYGLGKDKVDLDVGKPTLDTETVYYLSREDVEGNADKKQEGVLAKIKNGIVAFFKWIWNAISGFFKAIGRFFSGLFGGLRNKAKAAEKELEKAEKKAGKDHKKIVDFINSKISEIALKSGGIFTKNYNSFIVDGKLLGGYEYIKLFEKTDRSLFKSVEDFEKWVSDRGAFLKPYLKEMPKADSDLQDEILVMDGTFNIENYEKVINKHEKWFVEEGNSLVYKNKPGNKSLYIDFVEENGITKDIKYREEKTVDFDKAKELVKRLTIDGMLIDQIASGDVYDSVGNMEDKIRGLDLRIKNINNSIGALMKESIDTISKWTPNGESDKKTIKALENYIKNYCALNRAFFSCVSSSIRDNVRCVSSLLTLVLYGIKEYNSEKGITEYDGKHNDEIDRDIRSLDTTTHYGY